MLLTGVTWQAPHKLNAIAIPDIYHSNIVIIFRMASSSGTTITDNQIDIQSGRMYCTIPKGTLNVMAMANCVFGAG